VGAEGGLEKLDAGAELPQLLFETGVRLLFHR
jgi:hypothetical protein